MCINLVHEQRPRAPLAGPAGIQTVELPYLEGPVTYLPGIGTAALENPPRFDVVALGQGLQFTPSNGRADVWPGAQHCRLLMPVLGEEGFSGEISEQIHGPGAHTVRASSGAFPT